MPRWRQHELILHRSMRALLNTKIHLCMISRIFLFVVIKIIVLLIRNISVSPCQADVTFSSDNFSHREQTEPMPQQYSDLRV